MNCDAVPKIVRTPADKGGYLGQHLAGPLVFRLGVEEIEKEIKRGVFGENPSKFFPRL
jgi:hypothetical protein